MATGTGAVVPVPSVVLAKGRIHLMATTNRIDPDMLTLRLFTIYGTGKSLRLNVAMRGGRTIKVRITGFDFQGFDKRIGFTGEIANGGEFAKVTGSFLPSGGGSFQIVD